jgi:dihydrofolate reductase
VTAPHHIEKVSIMSQRNVTPSTGQQANAAQHGATDVSTRSSTTRSRSVAYMSMSLDGYIATPDDHLGGEDGNRLHRWFIENNEFIKVTGPAAELIDEYESVGAILAGRRTVEIVDHWGGDHQGRPVFVPSHRPPGPSVADYPLVTYVLDGIESAMAQAKAAAGDRNVLVHGGYTAQRAIEAGVLDELQIHHIPVLLGRGRRMFDLVGPHVELDIVRVIGTPQATHVRYRVRR